MNQPMRIQIEPHSDLRAAPRSLYRGGRRVDIIEIVDQWYGPGYRYVKVRGHDTQVLLANAALAKHARQAGKLP